MAIKDNTWPSQLVVDKRAKVVELLDRLGVRSGITRSIVEDSCASLVLSLRKLVANFRAVLNKSVTEAFGAGCIGFQLFANTAIDGITVHDLKGAAWDDGDGSTKNEDFVDPTADPGSLNCS